MKYTFKIFKFVKHKKEENILLFIIIEVITGLKVRPF